jgi:type IV pilus assembly protein PilE
MEMKPRATAFTLLEPVIAIAIAATLAVFVVPSYRSHVVRSYRMDAASSWYRAAQFVEAASGNDAPSLPAGLDQAPAFGTAIYRLRMLPGDETNGGYSVEAKPVESGPMRDDACGTYVLNATGLRVNRDSGDSTAKNPHECWNTR